MAIMNTADISAEERRDFDQYVAAFVDKQNPSPQLKDLLLSLRRCLQAGDEIIMNDQETDIMLTPNQIAERLGASRTHVYALLDRGEIPFDRVGRDRRVHLKDVIAFEARRQEARRELAEKFAHQSQIRAAAVDEMLDLL